MFSSDFNIVIERVILKEHGDTVLISKQHTAHINPFSHQLAKTNRQVGLARDTNFQIGSSIPTHHPFKATEQIGAQGLAHALSTNHPHQPIVRPVKALRLGRVQEVLEKGWIASDQVTVIGAKET